MEKHKPPIRVVAPGRVYRPDTVDATHLFMFHQLEALVVDEGVTMVDLKTTIDQFIHAFFGPETQWRFRPSFFPFTEPSAPRSISCRTDQTATHAGSSSAAAAWSTPTSSTAVGIDTEKYTGWAFGFGIERLAMRKYDIPDIRWLTENDLRFLRQFYEDLWIGSEPQETLLRTRSETCLRLSQCSRIRSDFSTPGVHHYEPPDARPYPRWHWKPWF